VSEGSSGRPRTEATLDPAQAGAAPADRFQAIYEIGRRLFEERDPDAVVRAIEESLVTHLDPDRLCLLDRTESGRLRGVLARGLDPAESVDSWPLSWTVVRQVLDGGLAVLASDTRREARLAEAHSIQRFRIRSIVCVPLGRPARGVLYLDNRSARPFSEGDLQFVAAVARYAELALARSEEHARARRDLEDAGARLQALQAELLRFEIVGQAPALLSAYDTLRRLARAGARVLLRGETGTGKELFARAYAANSPRQGGPWVPVTIPALAPTLVESELFGHLRGAFTEARADKKGRLEVASAGILFLDEVGDVEPAIQTKLLRFLDSGELFRVGDTAARHVDALVVSATNRPLERDVEEGRFRADLYARLGHTVIIPPLRERPDDVPLLVDHFLRVYGRGRPPRRFSPEALAVLQAHRWPFNVRELQQVVERAVVLAESELIAAADLPEYLRRIPVAVPGSGDAPPGPLKAVVQQAERAHIARALAYTRGNRRRAIELLQIAPETFYRRLQEFGLE
jgi:DNA-binding NtrC family response regulator